MASIFTDLCSFFGISVQSPQTLGELFPWLIQILIAVVLVLFVFSIIKDFVKIFARGKF